jgi:hypothetical protein
MIPVWANFVFAIIAIFAVGFGIFICLRPLSAFEMQRRFYALINWRIEPISVEKEIRNTRLMGICLIVFVILATFYVIKRS